MFVFIQFGESQKLRLVRILRSTVMVRVGGGWVALDEFLVKNDPCRGKFYIYIHIMKSKLYKITTTNDQHNKNYYYIDLVYLQQRCF